MRLEEVRLGARVRVREGYRKPEMRGLSGTVEEGWGNPDYHTALLVRLDDGRSELFWHHELEEVEEAFRYGDVFMERGRRSRVDTPDDRRG